MRCFLLTLAIIIAVSNFGCQVRQTPDPILEELQDQLGGDHDYGHASASPCVRAIDGPHDRTLWAEVVEVDWRGHPVRTTKAKLGQDPAGQLCDDQRLDAINQAQHFIIERCQLCNENMIKLPGWRCCSEVFGQHEHPKGPVSVRYVVHAR